MYSVKVREAVPLANSEVLVFFEDGKTKKFDVKPLMAKYSEFEALRNTDLFDLIAVEPGGYGISWNEDLDCSECELYEKGVEIPLSIEDFHAFVKHNLITTGEATKILHCSRQNIDDLVRRGKIIPAKVLPNGNLFLRSDIEKRVI